MLATDVSAQPTVSSPPTDLHPRDLLRDALEALYSLSDEMAAAESSAEAEHTRRQEAVLKHAQRDGHDAEERHRKLRQQVTTEHTRRLAEAEAQRDNALKVAKETHARSVLLARRTRDDQLSQIQKKIQEAEWLADSLLEGVEAAAQKHAKEANETVQKSTADLEDREAKSIQALAVYNQQHLILDTPPAPAPLPDDLDERHARSTLASTLQDADEHQQALERVELAKIFVGITPFFVGTALVAAFGLIGQATTLSLTLDPLRALIGAGVGFLIACGLGIYLKAVGNRRVRAALAPLRQDLENARTLIQAVHRLTLERIKSDRDAARLKRDEEVRSIRDRHAPTLAKIDQQAKSALATADTTLKDATAAADAAHAKSTAFANAWLEKQVHDLASRYDTESNDLKRRLEREQAENAGLHDQAKQDLQARWTQGLGKIAWATRISQTVPGTTPPPWAAGPLDAWETPATFPPAVRFGELSIDATATPCDAPDAPTPWRFEGLLPSRFTVPAMLAFGPNAQASASSAMFEFSTSAPEGRGKALSALRSLTARLLSSIPPGRLRLTFIDPIGLGQTFAGFMHLADHDEQLTGPRIWTDPEQIDRRLSDLAEHMETVIQKYLRNEFQSIDAYNAQAGELAEPYRFLVVADFPTGFSHEALKKLTSILSAGARCGVHVLLARDTRVSIEKRIVEDLHNGMTTIEVGEPAAPRRVDAATPTNGTQTNGDGHAATADASTASSSVALTRWLDPVFSRHPLSLDPEPDDQTLTTLCRLVGEGAKRANRVQVDFRALLPVAEQRWGGSTASEFRVPVGRSGATRLQYLRFGKGVSQHGLIAGKTGSGKSTLLHVMVTAAAQWFTPAEVEFYLIDFKKGVEFKAYVDGQLPHCKAVAIESDREFGLSVLQRLDAELTRRGELYRQLGVQDLESYRLTRHPVVLPRVILVVDEFQEFFSEDDRLSQEASALLDRLVRQGRAFGMHVLLGSQTIGGSAGLPRATLGQMAVRIALQCSETDSTMILGESNTAARLLTRPGEAIYNDNGGLPEANSPFQVAWLPDEKRDQLLAEISAEARQRNWTYDAVVFEGNKPVNLPTHRALHQLATGSVSEAPTAVLGEPVAIKPATRVLFRAQPGSNMLLIGQHEEAAMATLQAALTSLSLTTPGARFLVLEGTMADSPLKGALKQIPQLASATMSQSSSDALTYVDYRDVEESLRKLHAEFKRREENPNDPAPPIFVLIYALQRYRALRKQGDDFSFSLSGDDEPKQLAPDKILAELLKEGPVHRIHILAWADTLTSLERIIDRGLMREFDHRILFQMSAADSSALIDSPAANRLGSHRALLFSEEQGVLEKFRPYAPVLP